MASTASHWLVPECPITAWGQKPTLVWSCSQNRHPPGALLPSSRPHRICLSWTFAFGVNEPGAVCSPVLARVRASLLVWLANISACRCSAFHLPAKLTLLVPTHFHFIKLPQSPAACQAMRLRIRWKGGWHKPWWTVVTPGRLEGHALAAALQGALGLCSHQASPGDWCPLHAL